MKVTFDIKIPLTFSTRVKMLCSSLLFKKAVAWEFKNTKIGNWEEE